MKIFISDIDKQNARSVVLKNIARYFNIPDWAFKSNDDLQLELGTLGNPEAKTIIQLLNNYFSAYNDWFNFYQKRKVIEAGQDSDNELNDSEQQELQTLINRREDTLAALQTEFDMQQLQKSS